jgi:hypothetical protein
MPQPYKIYHAKDPKFGFNDPEFNLENYFHVATVHCSGLESAFYLTNHVSHDWTTNSEVIWRNPSQHRSTSVGDVIEDSVGNQFRCKMAGWEQIKKEES